MKAFLKEKYWRFSEQCKKKILENNEGGGLYQLYKSPNIITIEVPGFKFAGHVNRIAEKELARKIKKNYQEGGRSRGVGPKLRRMDGVGENLSKLGIKDGKWSLGIGRYGSRNWGRPRVDKTVVLKKIYVRGMGIKS